MEIKSFGTFNLEFQKEERVYRFTLPYGAPYGEAYDAAFQFLNKVLEMQNKAVEEMQQKAAETKE